MTTLTWGVAGKVAYAASLLVFLTVAVFTGPVSAEEISLPVTGQKYCYDFAGTKLKSCQGTGQDAEFQVGVPMPSPRFSVSFDGCAFTDRLTRLIWAGNAKQICSSDWNDAINAVNTLTYCGKTDWRAANVNELESLASTTANDLYAWLAGTFAMPSTYFFFSSTSYINDDTINPAAWGMDMRDGTQYNINKLSNYCVWPVRGNTDSSALARVAQTGQELCYDASNAQLVTCNGSGQDAEWLAGASWPIPRYYVNLSSDNVTPDGTITDLFTNLMWTTDAATAGPGDSAIDPELCANDPATSRGVFKSWQQALDFVKICLNSATDPWLGYRDWRLPNKNELASLIDRSVAPNTPALEADQPFQNVIVETDPVGLYPQAAGHWSSTTSLKNPGAAKIVDMTFGDIISLSKGSGRLHVWPVRGNYPLLQVNIANAGGGGTGTVTTSPKGVGCTTYCAPEMCPSDEWPEGSARYPEDKKVTLKAKAATNSVFTGWTVSPGVCEGKGSCTVSMVSDITVTANFTSLATLSLTPATKKYSKTKTTKTSSATFTLKDLTTYGKQPLSIDSIELTGTNADQFLINPAKDKCTGQTLGAGKSCTIQVVFAPTSAGAKTAVLSVSSADDPDSPRTATLSGEGALP